MFAQEKIKTLITELQHLLKEKSAEIQKDLLEQYMDEVLSFLHDFSNLLFAIDSSIIVAATDTSGKIIYANKKFTELSKYSHEELIGNDHRIINSGYHEKAFFKEMWKTISKGEIWEGEVCNKAKDGKYYWVKTTIVPIKNSSGKPILYIALRTDITKEKMAREKLVEALRNDFRFVANALYNIIFKVKKINGKFVYTMFEGRLAKDLQLETEKVYNHSPDDIFPPSIAEYIKKHYEIAFSGETVTYTYSFNNKYLLTYLSPIFEKNKIVEIIGSVNDVTELHHAQEEVKYMAYHDLLTNLPNRRKFNQDLEGLIPFTEENNGHFAIFYIDLDRFKQINDSFGHSTGDLLIQEVAKRLEKLAKPKGYVYRFNADEFIIVLPSFRDIASVHQYAQKIIEGFEEKFELTNSLNIYITPSIGVSLYPYHGETSEQLLKNADTAMFVAKSSGKNQMRVYHPSMSEHHKLNLKIEHYLRQAIMNNEFELYFQPKYHLKSKKITSMEALLRWTNPVLGTVRPDQFIPIAEDTGLIIKIDEWVLEEACKLNKKWNEQLDGEPLRVAVNISALHFRMPNFVETVYNILQKTGLPPHLLEIEITERSFIGNLEAGLMVLSSLRKLGVHVALDDFGTGYSSLNYLRKFPITTLKIDRSFIQEAEKEGDSPIIKAMIYLSHELDLQVVAEGTETKDVIHLLESLGCDEIQGYYISKPVPKDQFLDTVKKLMTKQF